MSFGTGPTLGFSVDPSAPQLSSLKLVSGRWPGATQLVVDSSTASKKHLKVGQLIGVQADGPASAPADLGDHQVRLGQLARGARP